ncbi:copper resistance protein D [Kribbella jejuensis]|uniref:Copper resistance protein D n=2 Tax=Kribbella jejuensis TaxID=236068 RepID=A0A542EQ12_9ACTN|nr:copper resistance protein D [Kribbella jejuensis]
MPGRLVVGGMGAVVVASVGLVGALYAAGSEPQNAGGIGGPSEFWSWLLPLLRLIATLATVGCAGALLAAVVVLRIEGGSLGVQGRRAVRDASNAALIWAICAFASSIVTAALLLNTPMRLLGLRIDDALGVPEVKALLITGILVLALSIGIRRVQTSSAAGLGVLVAIAALVPTAVTTYPRNESYVVLAGAALVVHVIAATTWVGGLAGLVRYGRASRSGLPIVLERYGQVAIVSAVAVALSGLISGAGRLAAKGGGWDSVLDELTGDAYGALLLAKLVAFVLLVVLAAVHRTTATGDLLDSTHAFWRVVGVELLVMALTLGLAVALSQTA